MSERNYNFCPYCGKKLPQFIRYETNFCGFCGRRLKKNKENLIKKVQCIICHKPVDPNRHNTIKCSYCGSMYHSICVSSWLLKYNACPMCQNVFLFPNKIIPISKE
ncbi:MAG: RING finger domain-containing protein [Candidatus Hodarchaeota archaeon]